MLDHITCTRTYFKKLQNFERFSVVLSKGFMLFCWFLDLKNNFVIVIAQVPGIYGSKQIEPGGSEGVTRGRGLFATAKNMYTYLLLYVVTLDTTTQASLYYSMVMNYSTKPLGHWVDLGRNATTSL